jgi:cobalt-zinc-cadmium efflux system membrane fusion protein
MKSWTCLLWLVLGALAAGCHPATKPGAAPPPRVEQNQVTLPADSAQSTAIAVEPATPHATNRTRLTGRLVRDDDVTVRVFSPVGGRVTALPAGLGQPVAAWDVLAKIDSPDFGQAQADVRKATADLLLAEHNLERLKILFEHGAAPRKDLDAAEDAHAGARSEKERATARLSLYGGREGVVDEIFSLRSPIAGVVVEKNVNPGQEIRPDAMLGNVPAAYLPLFMVSDPRRLWVLLDATELDLPLLRSRQEIVIHTPAFPTNTFAGTIEVLGDALDPTTRTVKVRGLVPNPDRRLKAEMYVTVDVLGEASADVDIPAKAVFVRDNKPYVFVEESAGRFERREVKLGPENSGRIAVKDGLAIGQRVVTEGCLLLQTLLEASNQP